MYVGISIISILCNKMTNIGMLLSIIPTKSCNQHSIQCIKSNILKYANTEAYNHIKIAQYIV